MKKDSLLSLRVFRTIVFILIVISTMFRPICPPAFFGFMLNSGTFMELRTMSFIESMGVTCSDSIRHNWVQVLSIPVLLLAYSQDWTWLQVSNNTGILNTCLRNLDNWKRTVFERLLPKSCVSLKSNWIECYEYLAVSGQKEHWYSGRSFWFTCLHLAPCDIFFS